MKLLTTKDGRLLVDGQSSKEMSQEQLDNVRLRLASLMRTKRFRSDLLIKMLTVEYGEAIDDGYIVEL